MYNIGQYRFSSQNNYLNPLQYSIAQIDTTIVSINFKDICGQLSGDNVMNNQNCYYLHFKVKKRSDSIQSFYLKLKNSLKTEDNEQIIEQYTVDSVMAGVDQWAYFEVIISPNAEYDQIIWELQRINTDFNNSDNQSQKQQIGRIMNIEIQSYAQLVDIVTTLKNTYPKLKYLTKIGIQGPPALLTCINGEQIRLGRNGIYEINNGIKITSISFVPKSSDDYFIMDFEY